MWQAYNPTARDFRLNPTRIEYTSVPVHEDPDGSYVGRPVIPAEGWRAAFLEFHFDVASKEFIQTTAVAVLPDVLPFPPCGFPCECRDDCPPPVLEQ